MSQATETTIQTQETAPETAPETVQGEQQTAQEAKAKAEKERAALAITSAVAKIGERWNKLERGATVCWYECGKEAKRALEAWLSVYPGSRADGIDTIRADLIKVTGQRIDVNELLKFHAMVDLLNADGSDGWKKVAFRTLRELLPLVERSGGDGAETWTVIERCERKGINLFGRIVAADVPYNVAQATVDVMTMRKDAQTAEAAELRKLAEAETDADKRSKLEGAAVDAEKRAAKLADAIKAKKGGKKKPAPAAAPSAEGEAPEQREGPHEMAVFKKTLAALAANGPPKAVAKEMAMLVNGRAEVMAEFLECLEWSTAMQVAVAEFLADTAAGKKVRSRTAARLHRAQTEAATVA
jgi:hypothetical protein